MADVKPDIKSEDNFVHQVAIEVRLIQRLIQLEYEC